MENPDVFIDERIVRTVFGEAQKKRGIAEHAFRHARDIYAPVSFMCVTSIRILKFEG